MINSKSLTHPTMVSKIKAANHNAITLGYSVDHVQNRHGVPVLAFRYNSETRKMKVVDRHGRNLTKQVAKALWS